MLSMKLALARQRTLNFVPTMFKMSFTPQNIATDMSFEIYHFHKTKTDDCDSVGRTNKSVKVHLTVQLLTYIIIIILLIVCCYGYSLFHCFYSPVTCLVIWPCCIFV